MIRPKFPSNQFLSEGAFRMKTEPVNESRGSYIPPSNALPPPPPPAKKEFNQNDHCLICEGELTGFSLSEGYVDVRVKINPRGYTFGEKVVVILPRIR